MLLQLTILKNLFKIFTFQSLFHYYGKAGLVQLNILAETFCPKNLSGSVPLPTNQMEFFGGIFGEYIWTLNSVWGKYKRKKRFKKRRKRDQTEGTLSEHSIKRASLLFVFFSKVQNIFSQTVAILLYLMVFGSNPIMYTIQQNSNIVLYSVRSHNCTISNIVIKVLRMATKWRKAHSSLFQNSPRLPQSLHLLARKHMQRPTRRQIIPVDSEF